MNPIVLRTENWSKLLEATEIAQEFDNNSFYSLLEQNHRIEWIDSNLTMGTDHFEMQPHLINGLIVTFFQPLKELDRNSLQTEAKKHFPKAIRILPKERLEHLLNTLIYEKIQPIAYQKLVNELEKQPLPTIDPTQLKPEEIPDTYVSANAQQHEHSHLDYYQQKNPDFESPQKILFDHFLAPRLAPIMESVFPAIKTRMVESRIYSASADFENCSVLARILAGRIMVTIRKDEDFIHLLGEDDHKKAHVSLEHYCGKLNNLVTLIDTVVKNWDPEKLQKDEIEIAV